jgi:hypothetical protein
MLPIVRLIAVVCFISCLGSAYAAPVHTVTWEPKNASPGTEVTLGGESFVLVRVPLRTFGDNQDYTVRFLAPVFQRVLFATLTTEHNADPLEDPIELDGFDVTAVVSDGRNYTIEPSLTSPARRNFTVTAQTFCTVQIKVGVTRLTLGHFFTTNQQQETDIGRTEDAVPFAQWDDYVHPTAQVRACDRWIDYIRIRRRTN